LLIVLMINRANVENSSERKKQKRRKNFGYFLIGEPPREEEEPARKPNPTKKPDRSLVSEVVRDFIL